MPVSYNGKKIIPAPFVDISKDYIKTSDGEKIGSTFTITLEGTMLPYKGSPNSLGAFHTGHGYPSDENIPPDRTYYSLLKKTEALRDLFSSEGKILKIVSWYDEDGVENDNNYPAIYGYPRVVNVSFPSNQYVTNPTYNISLELDEVFGMETASAVLGQEDFRNIASNIIPESGNAFSDEFRSNAGGGNKIYVAAANESWNADNPGQAKGCAEYAVTQGPPAGNPPVTPPASMSYTKDESPTFTLTHTVSATGKRAYDADGLIRQPWENSRMWVEARLAFPSGETIVHLPIATTHVDDMFSTGPAGVGFTFDGNEYGAYNHIRSQQIDKKGGVFSATDTWLLAKAETAAVIEQISVDTSFDDSTEGFANVTLNGTIQGLEVQDISNAVIDTKYDSALERYNFLSANAHLQNGILPLLATVKTGETMTTPYLQRTVSKNESAGIITFSYLYNNRSQSISGTVSESATFTEVVGVDKYAIIDVPHRASGPIVEDLGTKNLSSATCNISITLGSAYRTSKPTVSNTVFYDMCGVPAGHDIRNVTASLIVTADQESWDSKTGRYTKTKTFQWSC